MDNMPILYRNIMDGLPSDFAREVFLWATERPENDSMCYRAEAFAREAAHILSAVGHLLDASSYCQFRAAASGVPSRIISEAQRADLLGFVLHRHANSRFGGNLSAPYALRVAA